MSVFIIERVWFDGDENDASRAMGYEPIGYVDTEREAKSIVEAAGIASIDKSWVLKLTRKPAPKKRYFALERIGG